MVPRIFALLTAVSVAGCGASETPPPPTPEQQQAPAVPQAELRMILDGLKSENPRVQYAALNTLDRFPTVVQTYREHVERLKTNGKDKRVRQKATELLASLEE